MSLRLLTRLSAAAAAACVVAGTVVMVTTSAGALSQDRITLRQDDVVERTYPAIVGNNPEAALGGSSTYGPDVCQTSAYCDVIPLTVEVPPGLTEDDEYFVQITLAWETAELPVDALEPGGFAANDMDMFVYNDPVDDPNRPTEAGEPYATHGATGGQPELAYLFKPHGDYSIVVVNFAGVNRGYALKLVWVSETLPTPFEDLGPDFSAGPAGPPPNLSLGSPAPDAPVAAPAPAIEPFALPPAPLDVDPTFGDGFATDDGFEDDLAAPPAPVSIRPAAATKPEPPSTVALLLWMAALPLACVALFGTLVARRSTSLIQL
jgi:hypothetical protein